jgi:pimeloyl-ACP methyl ester carboxylesterase/DNA-binding CsgD family transcriptional regulator
MNQDIQFCTAPDGVQIAYSVMGSGPPLVKAPNWMAHLEYELSSPVWSHWWEELAKRHTLVRFDQRGSGLSERNIPKQSVDSWVTDLAAVTDDIGLDRFALMGISQGGAVATKYIAQHPGRATHLILYGAFGRGRAKRGDNPQEDEALEVLTKAGWGRNDPAYRQLFTSRFMPGANLEQMRWFNDLQKISSSGENAANVLAETSQIDVLPILGDIDVPTLVLHVRGDAQVPFEQGRQLAAMIPGSRFVPLEGTNHLMMAFEPSWATAISEVQAFLSEDGTLAGAPAPITAGTEANDGRLPAGLTPREGEVLKLVATGQSNRDIAGGLFITTNTVANHVKNILSKTRSANRTEAAAFAVANGLN